MSILIKGMEMPKEKIVLSITPDGEVQRYDRMFGHTFGEKFEAVHIPAHGRLIDADELRNDWLENGENAYVYDTNSFLWSLDDAPTVIPAEEGET